MISLIYKLIKIKHMQVKHNNIPRNNLNNLVSGAVVYNTSSNKLEYYDGTSWNVT